MAKQSGLNQRLYVAGFNISGDVGTIQNINGGPNPLDVTGMDKSAMERIGGVRDGALAFSSYFNPASNQAYPVLSALPTVDFPPLYVAQAIVGGAAASMIAKQAEYGAKEKSDGSYIFDSKFTPNGFGLEWGVLLTNDLRTDAGATSPATGLDQTVVSTSFGWQAYMQCTAFTGTSVTLTLQDSADNSAFANFAGGGGVFTAVSSAPATQRLASPGATDTVRRFIKVNSSGTFSSASFIIMFVRNQTVVTF